MTRVEKIAKIIMIAGAAVLAMNITAYAGSWKQNENGWYWQDSNGTFPSSVWEWLDGNNDGISECYYFDEEGYLVTNATTPDGNQVDADGRWVSNGMVQTRAKGKESIDLRQVYKDAIAKTAALNSYDATVRFEVPGSGDTNLLIDMSIKVQNRNSSKAKYVIDAKADIDDDAISISMFYNDGILFYRYLYDGLDDDTGNDDYSYYDYYNGSWQRQEFRAEAVDEQYGEMIEELFFDAEDMADIQLVSLSDGNQKLEFYAVDNEAETSYRNRLYLGGEQVKELRGTVTISADGYIVENDIQAKAESGGTMGEVNLQIRYTNPGQYVSITIPSIGGY